MFKTTTVLFLLLLLTRPVYCYRIIPKMDIEAERTDLQVNHNTTTIVDVLKNTQRVKCIPKICHILGKKLINIEKLNKIQWVSHKK